MIPNPATVAHQEFSTSLRGYSRTEVRAFLADLAASLAAAPALPAGDGEGLGGGRAAGAVAPAPAAALDHEPWGPAGASIARVLEAAHAEAAALVGSAEEVALSVRADLMAEADRTRAAAQADRDEAARLLHLAEVEASRMTVAAEGRAAEIVRQAEARAAAVYDNRHVEAERSLVQLRQEQATIARGLRDLRSRLSSSLDLLGLADERAVPATASGTASEVALPALPAPAAPVSGRPAPDQDRLAADAASWLSH